MEEHNISVLRKDISLEEVNGVFSLFWLFTVVMFSKALKQDINPVDGYTCKCLD